MRPTLVIAGLFVTLGPACAEPGPMPRVVRLDSDGDILPDGALMRFGSKRFRELKAAQVQVSPDGKSAICWGNEGVRVWNLADGKLLRSWSAPETQAIRSLTPDGRFAVTTPGAAIEVWDTRTDKRVARRSFNVYPYTRPVAISPDGATIAYGDHPDYEGVWVWELDTDRTRNFGKHQNDLHSVQFFGNGRRLLTWTPSGETTCWDVSASKQLWKDKFDNIAPLGSGDGRFVIGSRWQPNARTTTAIVNAETGKVAEGMILPPFDSGFVGPISDDARFVAGSSNGVRGGHTVWDTKTGTTVRRLQVGRRSFAPDGRSIISVDRSIECWDTLSDKKLGGARAEEGPVEPIRHLAWSPDGRTLAARAGYGSALYLWDAGTGKLRFHRPASRMWWEMVAASLDSSHWMTIEFGEKGLLDVRLTPREWRDGKTLGTPLTANIPNGHMLLGAVEIVEHSNLARLLTRKFDEREKAIQICDFDWSTGKPSTPATFDFPSGVVPAISPDGRFLLGEGRLFEVDRLADSPVLKRVDDRIPDFAIRADGSGFVVATALKRSPDPKTGKPRGASDIAVYDRLTGSLLRHIVTDESGLFALSPDGRTVAELALHRIRFWDVATGKEIRRYEVKFPFAGERSGSCGTALSFSPDGRRLAVGHWDATVVVWEAPGRDALSPPLTPAELDRLWADLAAPDAKTAWAAIRRLTDSSGQSVPYLANRVTPIVKLAEADTRRLLADLESQTFRIRELAAKRAREWGDQAKVVVDEALRGQPGPELKQRLESIATDVSWSNAANAEDLRRLRALAVLEQTATKPARAKIDELSGGLPGARVTQEAKLAKQRLAAGDVATKD